MRYTSTTHLSTLIETTAATMLSSNTPLPALFCPCLESLITYGVPHHIWRSWKGDQGITPCATQARSATEAGLDEPGGRIVDERRALDQGACGRVQASRAPDSEDDFDGDEDENGENGVDGNDDC